MKRFLLALCSIILIMSITGCSKSNKDYWISSDGTSIYIDGKSVMLSSFNGSEGYFEPTGGAYRIDYSLCGTELRDCLNNRQNVHEADVDNFKKAQYFIAFINTVLVMHMPNDSTSTKEAHYTSSVHSSQDPELKKVEIYETLNSLRFQTITKVTFDDKVVIDAGYYSITVTPENITIPGVLVVFKGTRDGTQQVDINGVTTLKYETANYDFYQYQDCLIKISKEYNVDDFITLK